MIAVTGATGSLGGMIIQELLDRVSADQVSAIVRNPEKTAELAAQGVSLRRGDYGDYDSLGIAFAGPMS